MFVGSEYPEANVTANVPLDVIGLPDILNPVGTDISTEVTVPTLHVLLADKSWETPLIVNVLDVGTNPENVPL